MEYELSGIAMLAGAMERAIQELNEQNYGKAKQILEDALENTQDIYLINKLSP